MEAELGTVTQGFVSEIWVFDTAKKVYFELRNISVTHLHGNLPEITGIENLSEIFILKSDIE